MTSSLRCRRRCGRRGRGGSGRTLPSPMNIQVDIAVQSQAGAIVALAEVKSYDKLEPNRAIELFDRYRGVLASTGASIFLLATQDEAFLWSTSVPAGPTRFSMAPVIAAYASWLEPNGRLRPYELELVVANWLEDVIRGDADRRAEDASRVLRDIGLPTLAAGGRTIRDLAA